MFKPTTTLSTVSRNTLGLILTIVAASAMAEEYFTISDGQLERPTGYLAARPPSSGGAALPFDIGLARAVVRGPREYKE